jgi:hypothetical protein
MIAAAQATSVALTDATPDEHIDTEHYPAPHLVASSPSPGFGTVWHARERPWPFVRASRAHR